MLDGTEWTSQQMDLATAVMAAGSAVGAAVRIHCWSDAELVRWQKAADLAAERDLPRRGRFLTPLIEGGLLTESGVLVCFTAGHVPDWDDWTAELNAAFGQIAQLPLRAGVAQLSECTVIETESLALEAVETAVNARLFGTRVVGVSLRIVGGTPLEIPESLSLDTEVSGVSFEWTGEVTNLTLPITVASAGGPVHACAVVELSDGSRVSASGELQPASPPSPRWCELSDRDRAVFESAQGTLTEADAYFACPRCGKNHRLSRGFTCEEGVDGFFNRSSKCVLLDVGEVGRGQLIAIQSRGGTLRSCVLPAGAVAWIGDGVAMRGKAGWVLADENGRVLETLSTVRSGLYRAPNAGVWLIES